MQTIQHILEFVKNINLPCCSEGDHLNYPLTDIGLFSFFKNSQHFKYSQGIQHKKNELQDSNDLSKIQNLAQITKQEVEFQIFCPICRYNNETNVLEEQNKPFDVLPIKIFLKNMIEKLNEQHQKRESQKNHLIESIRIQIKDVKTIRKICQLVEQKLREALNTYQSMLQMREKSELFAEDILFQVLSAKKSDSQTLREQFEALQKECAVLFSETSSTYEIIFKDEINKNKQEYSEQIQKMLNHSSQMIHVIKETLELNLHEFDQNDKLELKYEEIKAEHEEILSHLQSQKLCDVKQNSSQQSIQPNDLSTTCQSIFREDLSKIDLLNKQTESFLINMKQGTKRKNQQLIQDEKLITQPSIFINSIQDEFRHHSDQQETINSSNISNQEYTNYCHQQYK